MARVLLVSTRAAASPRGASFIERLRTRNAIPPERGRPLRPTGRIGERTSPTAERAASMSAAELETLFYVSEIDRIEQWRHDALERAGYDPESALVLAASHDVDLHAAVGLLESGCTVDLALQILL